MKNNEHELIPLEFGKIVSFDNGENAVVGTSVPDSEAQIIVDFSDSEKISELHLAGRPKEDVVQMIKTRKDWTVNRKTLKLEVIKKKTSER